MEQLTIFDILPSKYINKHYLDGVDPNLYRLDNILNIDNFYKDTHSTIVIHLIDNTKSRLYLNSILIEEYAQDIIDRANFKLKLYHTLMRKNNG